MEAVQKKYKRIVDLRFWVTLILCMLELANKKTSFSVSSHEGSHVLVLMLTDSLIISVTGSLGADC